MVSFSLRRIGPAAGRAARWADAVASVGSLACGGPRCVLDSNHEETHCGSPAPHGVCFPGVRRLGASPPPPSPPPPRRLTQSSLALPREGREYRRKSTAKRPLEAGRFARTFLRVNLFSKMTGYNSAFSDDKKIVNQDTPCSCRCSAGVDRHRICAHKACGQAAAQEHSSHLYQAHGYQASQGDSRT